MRGVRASDFLNPEWLSSPFGSTVVAKLALFATVLSISGLHDFEQHLNGVPTANVLHLRPCFFMENFLFQIEIIRRQDQLPGPGAGPAHFLEHHRL